MITHHIDIVAGAQPNHMSQVVKGEIRVDLGDPQREDQIRAMYRQTDEAVYTLLTGELPPKERDKSRD